MDPNTSNIIALSYRKLVSICRYHLNVLLKCVFVKITLLLVEIVVVSAILIACNCFT